MKELLLCCGIFACGVLFATALFNGGRIMVFGLPVSGLLFFVLIRAALQELKR